MSEAQTQASPTRQPNRNGKSKHSVIKPGPMPVEEAPRLRLGLIGNLDHCIDPKGANIRGSIGARCICAYCKAQRRAV